jgi:hypothetical protein
MIRIGMLAKMVIITDFLQWCIVIEEVTFNIGSVHSAYAKLAPKDGALIHVAKYLGTSIAPKPREDQPELEELLDLMQPGWRQVLLKKRPLPSMVVSNAVVTASTGGLAERPDAKIADNLYIVGK